MAPSCSTNGHRPSWAWPRPRSNRRIEPIRLELLGTTEYITDTLTKTRSMFKGRVDKVHVTVNQAVRKGDPLIDLYSKDLAEAKSAFEIEHIQWIYDNNLLEARESLVKSKAISQQLFEETKNNEMKSHREYEVARHKLFVYGLTETEVDQVESESGSQKARMTLRSPIDGFVIERDVVPGNLYDENDTLLVIAPLERLWVWGNVFESDMDLVKLGQSWEIRFPFLAQKLQGKVEYISNRVDPNTHAVRVRTSIPNHEVSSSPTCSFEACSKSHPLPAGPSSRERPSSWTMATITFSCRRPASPTSSSAESWESLKRKMITS